MTPTELAAVIEGHQLWLAGGVGERADLRYADLSDANLSDADLSYANMSYANMSHAFLCYANMSEADLSYANLSYANMSHANMSHANMRYANMRHANMRYANMSHANMSYANMSHANMRYANMSHANLSYANLSDAFLCYASLDETKGLVWARSGPCGIGPREILGWWTPAEGLVIEAGCFRGSPAEMRTRVAAGGWEWPAADRDRLAASVEKHLARVEGDVTEWLAACGGAA